jgi:hypothetical protein
MSQPEILELQFKNGDKYKGPFPNNVFEGEGEYLFANGNRYKGSFKANLFHGKGQFYDNINGIIIESTFSNNQPTNPSLLITPNDGSEYFGDLMDGKRHGKGVLRFSKDDKVCKSYEGQFFEDLLHGKGVMLYKDGSMYEGEFRENKVIGTGRIVSENYEYEGDVVDGVKDGIGKIVYKKTGESYEGGFKEDMKNGQGEYKYKDGSVYRG